MINGIIQAISVKLKEVFNIKVYIDKVPQGFQSPCFQIKVVGTSETQIVDCRFKADTVLDVNYISDENIRDKRTGYGAVEEINGILDFITLENGDILRGTDRNTEIQDGGIHNFVKFSYFVYKQREKTDKMEYLDHKGGVRK